MTASTFKSAILTNIIDGDRYAGTGLTAPIRTGIDTIAVATTSIDEVADVILSGIIIPSDAIILDLLHMHTDLDTNATETLAFDFGVWALNRHKTTTSNVVTNHDALAEIDADLLVDGTTAFEDAVTNWQSLQPDSTTFGTGDRRKRVWELLGYDFDPQTNYIIGIKVSAVAATPQAGTIELRVDYIKN